MKTSRAFLCAFATLNWGAVWGAQGPTFSSRIEQVRVDVLVTDGGRVVTGLRAEDFDLREQGLWWNEHLTQLANAMPDGPWLDGLLP